MSVYLSYGVDDAGTYLHITTQASGMTPLNCPFCNAPLVAVRGKVRAEHFRHHESVTCKESLTQLGDIEGWHHFHLNYDAELVNELKQLHEANPKRNSSIVRSDMASSAVLFNRLIKQQLVTYNDFAGHYELSTNGKVVVGALSAPLFDKWMRERLQARIQATISDIEGGIKHKAYLGIEATRQQSIMTATLYLFEYQLEDKRVLYKIGRTSRDIDVRLKETIVDVENCTKTKVVKAAAVRSIGQMGYVEHYLHYRYRQCMAILGNHQEYFEPNELARNIKSEFTKLAKQQIPFNKKERFITTGRWRYEEKRLIESKKGIEKLFKSKKKLSLKEQEKVLFGRPKGTTENDATYLEKHQDIVTLIEDGVSINRTAEMTGKARRTVIRVKNRMGK